MRARRTRSSWTHGRAASGSKRCHEHILYQLRTQNSGIGVIKAAIEDFIGILDECEHRNQLEKYLKLL